MDTCRAALTTWRPCLFVAPDTTARFLCPGTVTLSGCALSCGGPTAHALSTDSLTTPG